MLSLFVNIARYFAIAFGLLFTVGVFLGGFWLYASWMLAMLLKAIVWVIAMILNAIVWLF